MSSSQTLHILPASSRNTTRLMKFMGNMHFDKEQVFFVYGKRISRVSHEKTRFNRFFISGRILSFLKKTKFFINSDKIIVHGFFNAHLAIYFLLFPFLLRKTYWVVWGGDLYSLLVKPKGLSGFTRYHIIKKVLARVDYIITYIRGDYELVRQHLNPKAEMIFSLMYPGNLYKPLSESNMKKSIAPVKILVGNSGAPSNNHARIFKKLYNNKSAEKIHVYCPLSYGDKDYIEHVYFEGRRYFGDNFFPLTEYMDLEEYVSFLSNISYAIFDYDRQQGLGNIISLLGLGKGVFLNSNSTPWTLFEEKDIKVLNVEELEVYDLEDSFSSENPEKVRAFFSKKNLQEQLIKCFD